MKLEFRLRQNHSGVSACGIILSAGLLGETWYLVVLFLIFLLTVNAEAHFMSSEPFINPFFVNWLFLVCAVC